MACKNDAEWEGSFVYKDNCVKWEDLTSLREDFNTLWDLLKKEEKQDGDKYGYIGEDNRVKEQLEPLATIEGFFSLRFDNWGEVDQIYFIITAGTILDRIYALSQSYSYDHIPQGTNFGPWIVWLKDQCHACTVFRFQNADIKYNRSIICNYNYIDNIDNPAWRGQCIYSFNGCNYPAEVLGDWQQYCHINWDWREPQYYQSKLINVAKKLFNEGPVCVRWDEPCTVTRRWCCGLYAVGHYTEDCNFNGPCEEIPGNVCRRLKWVSLGVTSSNPGEEKHGYYPYNSGVSTWDSFFCCPNQITGGQISGHVTQKISAIHLTDIWDRTNKMVGGKSLRKCFYNQCKYYQNNEKKYRWLHKESVPMYASGSTADIMDRKESCQNCDKAAVGQSICACNFNDINAMLDEYNSATCSCQNEGENKGKSLTNFGDISSCNCCKTKCCCDCKCVEDLTEEECKKKKCKRTGPTWLGVYQKGDSTNDEKLGDAVECGCDKIPPCDPPKPCCKTACCMGRWQIVGTKDSGSERGFGSGDWCTCATSPGKCDDGSCGRQLPTGYEIKWKLQTKHCEKDWKTIASGEFSKKSENNCVNVPACNPNCLPDDHASNQAAAMGVTNLG